jgi:uncharacterized protein YutE (UPF0331/DUF86 family)
MADDVLLNKAATIERCIARVGQIRQEHDLDSDQTALDAIILNLQRACEAAIDMAMHLVRVHSLGLPQETREAFTLLEQADIIEPGVADRMRAMVGFRNIAVRDYRELSMPIVKDIMDNRLGDFEQLVHQVLGTR